MRNKSTKQRQFMDACYNAMYEAMMSSFNISTSENESIESRKQRMAKAAANTFKEKMAAAFSIVDDHIISCDVIPVSMVVSNAPVTGKGILQ